MTVPVAATGKAPRESQVEMTEIIMPQHTNALGTVFGGVVMSWVDIAGATAALRHCRRSVVTASVDAISFLAPIRLGYVVILRAAVNFVGSTSCEVGVKVLAENPLTGELFHTASAYVTFVALDSNGRPTGAIPKLIPETDDEKRRFREAGIRRKARLTLKTELTGRLHGGG